VLRSYFLTPASKHKLTNPEEFQETIRGLKVSKALGPNGIPNGALKHFSGRYPSLPTSSMQRLTVAIFLYVAKAFDTVWIDGLL
jgi:hypothetical protein